MASRSRTTHAPRIDTLQLNDLVEGDSLSLAASQTVEGTRFADADLSGQDLTAAYPADLSSGRVVELGQDERESWAEECQLQPPQQGS